MAGIDALIWAPVPVDPLSDVLRALRLTGAVFFDVEAFAPWAAATPHGSAIRPSILPAAQHLDQRRVPDREHGPLLRLLLDVRPLRLAALAHWVLV